MDVLSRRKHKKQEQTHLIKMGLLVSGRGAKRAQRLFRI
jgi:hypothetical protein